MKKYILTNVLLIASVIVLIVCAFLAFGPRSSWKQTIADLQKQEQSLRTQGAPYEGAADEYKNYSSKYKIYSKDWDDLFRSIRTYNDNLTLILGELDTHLPNASSITKIDMTADGLTIKVSGESKEVLAHVIMSLQNLKYASLKSISDITGGTGKVSHTTRTSGEDIFATLQNELKQDRSREEHLFAELATCGAAEMNALIQKYGYQHTAAPTTGKFTQQKAAIIRMFSSNPFATKKFFEVVKYDYENNKANSLGQMIIDDDRITLEVKTKFKQIYTGEVTDTNTLLSYMFDILSVITQKDKIDTTIRIIQNSNSIPSATNTNLAQWYNYYLAKTIEGNANDTLVYLNKTACAQALINNNWDTGHTRVNEILLKYLYNPAVSGGDSENPNAPDQSTDSGKPDTSPSDDLFLSRYWTWALEKLGIAKLDLPIPEYIPIEIQIALTDWGKSGRKNELPQEVYNWFYHDYLPSKFPDNSGASTGKEGTRYYMTCKLIYREDVILQELARKGLNYTNKLEKLEGKK